MHPLLQMLPIEKAAEKDRLRAEEDKRLEEEEIKASIAQNEKFVLPSGQEIEKENILF